MTRIDIDKLNAMIEKLEKKKIEAIKTIDDRLEKAKIRFQKAQDALEILENQKAKLEENK